jgi:RNA recognition motif-containing protein
MAGAVAATRVAIVSATHPGGRVILAISILTAALTDIPHQIRAFRLLRSSPSIPLEPSIRSIASRDAGVVMNTKLYVGNLPFETTQADLEALFQPMGQVNTVNIVRDRATGQARGFAFVEMSDAEGARRAIAELDRHQLGGRSLTVNEARPMAARPAGGGFGGGRQKREPRW